MIAVEQMQSFINDMLWAHTRSEEHARVRSYFFATLFVIGIVYWFSFFNFGDLSFTAYDWNKETAYLDTLRLAQNGRVVPWQWGEAYYQGTDKFLANPEVILTPDIILLRWLPNGHFVIAHVVLFYSFGFLGCLLLAKKLALRFFSFSFFGLLFNFNGYLTAHLAVGHFQWTGYYLLPFFFLILLSFREETPGKPWWNLKSVLAMALLLGVLFLNGSVHIAIWCSMFLGVLVLLRWSMFQNAIASILIGLVLGLGRLLPAIVWFHEKGSLLAGYPTINAQLDAFTSLHRPDFVGFQELIGLVGWWEYDIYIGFAAFLMMAISISVSIRRNQVPFQPYLIATALFFLFLSFGHVYRVVSMLPLPFTSIERLPSRFIIIPFIFFLIISAKGLDELLNFHENQVRIFLVVGFLMSINELLLHFDYWRVSYIEEAYQTVAGPSISLAPCLDQVYMNTVYLGWSISLAAYVVVFVVFVRAFAMNVRPFHFGKVRDHRKQRDPRFH